MPRSFRSDLEVDIDNDGRLQVKCHPMFAKELGKVLREIADEARELVRRRHSNKYPRHGLKTPGDPRKTGGTGRLRSSIQPYRGRAAEVRRVGPHMIVGNVTAGSARAPYARYVHEGTRPHIIAARPGGHLAFVSTNRTGKKLKLRLMTHGELTAFSGGKSDNAAVLARARRYAGRTKSSRLRSTQADVVPEMVTTKLKDRIVVTERVHHPGYKGDRFLNEAAAKVVAGRYGGRVNLPRRSLGQ